MTDTPKHMPEVDRVAANQAAVAARQARARLKNKLRTGELSPIKALDEARQASSPASSLRVVEFLQTFPGVGEIKSHKILEQLGISARKRLGGLGVHQREKLLQYVIQKSGFDVGSQQPSLTVLAGPTAVGKGSVAQYIRDNYPHIKHSVSVTTRPPRPGEVHGFHYLFVDDEAFDRLLAQGEMLEWATVHSSYKYGTPRGPVQAAAQRGDVMLLEIDLQGARQVRASMPSARLVFLAPPSWQELVNRLVGRATESAEERAIRLETAKTELEAADEFDVIIVNDEVHRAAAELVAIMTGQQAE